ncbi:hypothetical protein [Fictibacillus sp. FJAT-27399]|nr:hypothetical protein [Fictibacillus sp. FJAT-27399]
MISVPGCSLSAGRALSPQESRTLHSNQLVKEDLTKIFQRSSL